MSDWNSIILTTVDLKVDYDVLDIVNVTVAGNTWKDEADELYSRLDNMDGSKASSFTVQGDTSRNEGSSETVSGCLTVLGWIAAGLICIAFFI